MVGKEGLYPQFCPVFPFHRCITRIKQGVDTVPGKEDSHDAGIANLYSFCPKFFDLPRMVEDGKLHVDRFPMSALVFFLKQQGLLVPEKADSGIEQHGVDDG